MKDTFCTPPHSLTFLHSQRSKAATDRIFVFRFQRGVVGGWLDGWMECSGAATALHFSGVNAYVPVYVINAAG